MKIVLNGWWRLWLVLSVVYGAIIAALFWPSPLDAEYIPHTPSFVSDMSPDTQKVVEQLEFEDLLRRKHAAFGTEAPTQSDLPPKSEPIILKMPNGHEFQLPGNTTEEQAKHVGQEYVRVLNNVAEKNRRAANLKAFLVWLVPSILCVALGLAFKWVRRGFQDHPK